MRGSIKTVVFLDLWFSISPLTYYILSNQSQPIHRAVLLYKSSALNQLFQFVQRKCNLFFNRVRDYFAASRFSAELQMCKVFGSFPHFCRFLQPQFLCIHFLIMAFHSRKNVQCNGKIINSHIIPKKNLKFLFTLFLLTVHLCWLRLFLFFSFQWIFREE